MSIDRYDQTYWHKHNALLATYEVRQPYSLCHIFCPTRQTRIDRRASRVRLAKYALPLDEDRSKARPADDAGSRVSGTGDTEETGGCAALPLPDRA